MHAGAHIGRGGCDTHRRSCRASMRACWRSRRPLVSRARASKMGRAKSGPRSSVASGTWQAGRRAESGRTGSSGSVQVPKRHAHTRGSKAKAADAGRRSRQERSPRNGQSSHARARKAQRNQCSPRCPYHDAECAPVDGGVEWQVGPVANHDGHAAGGDGVVHAPARGRVATEMETVPCKARQKTQGTRHR